MTGDTSWLHSALSTFWGFLLIALILGGSIFVHELGHFLAARWRGLKVECFSIGFGPAIWSRKAKDGVEYRLAWFPVGGYVRLPQLMDASMLEGEAASADPLPDVSYLDKMITVSAGVVFNLIFAFVIACVLWQIGVPAPSSKQTLTIGYVVRSLDANNDYQPLDNDPGRRVPPAKPVSPVPGPAFTAGLQPGDRILAIDGETMRDFSDVSQAIALGSLRDEKGNPRTHVTYERAGVTHELDVFPLLIPQNSRSGDLARKMAIAPADKIIVGDLKKNSPGELAGLQKDDEITAANGQPLYSAAQLGDLVNHQAGQPITLSVRHAGTTREIKVQPASIALSTPLVTITYPATTGEPAARLDLLPVYARDSQADPADPASPALNLLVWNLQNEHGVFGSLHPGDFLLEVNGQKVNSLQSVLAALQANPAGQPAHLLYASQEQKADLPAVLPAAFQATLTPPEETVDLGFATKPDMVDEHTPPFAELGNVIRQTFATVHSLFAHGSNVGVGMLSGPLGISSIIYKSSQVDLRLTLWFVILININLMIINLLPFPVLDGGNMVLFTLARIRGKSLPLNFLAWLQGIFIVLIMSLSLYIFFHDSLRMAGDSESEQQEIRNSYYYLKEDQVKFPAPPASTPPATTTASPTAKSS